MKSFRQIRKRLSRPQQNQPFFHTNRFRLIKILLLTVFSVLILRAATIILIPPSEDILARLARSQYKQTIQLSPYRGSIFDRRGEPLAISIRKPSIFINPRLVNFSPKQLQIISRLLKVPKSRLRKIASRRSYFAWIKRNVGRDAADTIAKLDIEGLHVVMEPARYYPAAGAASQLIGLVGIDNRGLLGLERQFESILAGDQIEAMRSKDAKGRIIYTSANYATPEKAGNQITLTIDRAIQEIAEDALKNGVITAKAKYGFAIVSDPHTGKILATANYPGFDPNNSDSMDINHTRNHALTDLFEPGSVIKPLVVARALDLNKTRLGEVFDVENGIYREDRWRIRDSHAEEELSTEGIIVESSNIGVYKIAKRLGPQKLYEAYREFGVGNVDQLVDFPQQAIGRLQDWQSWRSIRFANLSFGQGLMTSALEIVQAYGAIANGGLLMKPMLIEQIKTPSGRLIESHNPQVLHRVIKPETAKNIRRVLAKVVTDGTGKNARMIEFTAAGKTGTTEKVDPETHRYSDNLRIASFVGFAPVEDPHLVIYVVIDEPSVKPYYGGTWAAPVFREIAEQSLRYLNVAPDKRELEPMAYKPSNNHKSPRTE